MATNVFSADVRGKINQQVDQDMLLAKQHYTDKVESRLMEYDNLYYADDDYYKRKFPLSSKKSKYVSMDIANTISWAMPSFIRSFCGNDDIVSVKGNRADTDQAAELHMKLMKYQADIEGNNWFTFVHDWVLNSLKDSIGYAKISWVREFKDQSEEGLLYEDQYRQLQQAVADNPDKMKIIKAELVPGTVDLYRVKTKLRKLIHNYPRIEVILPSEIRYSPDAKNLLKASFVAHVRTVTADELLRREKDGIYTNVTKALESAEAPQKTMLEQQVTGYVPQRSYDAKDTRRPVELQECYTQFDINGDGLLEKVIVTRCGGEIIRIEENMSGRMHPFVPLLPIRDPHRVMTKKGFADLIAPLQHLKTAIIRQIQISLAQANEPRMVINEEAVDMNDFISGRQYVRAKNQTNVPLAAVCMPINAHQISPTTFPFVQYLEDQKTEASGVGPYTQGMNSESMNKTATGIGILTNSAAQRLEMYTRNMMESGFKELFRAWIELNQRFIDEEQVIRLTGEELVIRPDDLQGTFDLQVNASIASGSKQQAVQSLQMILNLLMPMMQAGLPFVQPNNIYNLLKQLITDLGYINTNDFLTDPEVAAEMQQQQIAQQMMGGVPGGQPATGGLPSQIAPANAGQQPRADSAGVPAGMGTSPQDATVQNLINRFTGGPA